MACRTLIELNLIRYLRIVRHKVIKEMEMMVTQPSNSKIEWKGSKKMIVLVPVYSKNLCMNKTNQCLLQTLFPVAEWWVC